MVQKTWNMTELMTHNLHTCICHVPEQAKKCGPTAFAGEGWLERLMQAFKRVTKYRCTRYPKITVGCKVATAFGQCISTLQLPRM